MSVSINYDNENNFLVVKVVGEITAEQHEACMSEIIASDNIPSHANALWDLTEMDFSLVDIELERQIAKTREQMNKDRGSAKVALVSSYDLGEPLLKLFKILTQHLDQQMKIFKTMENAKDWLTDN